MTNDDPSAQRATDQCDQRKERPSPPQNAPQGGPPLSDGLEQLRDSHT
ncbi:hypothetical protein GPL21_24070 [Bradyrhizobium pachyrhizi]|uniref:Uncharacterized protein n=1 Tax=Bradyrhizobium pachyrhizi TaxID=280333 RepID=A0A844SQ19_9BRAD|nr:MULTISPECIES: hypothetical protein [Bradyrhizobium]MVT68177.1 hypothetical protein [Bradyrhizobium pachyrhizi]WOH79174.1 hypothetical protein RX327_25160 [Bradyrhizobium sp. BEA-2-5]